MKKHYKKEHENGWYEFKGTRKVVYTGTTRKLVRTGRVDPHYFRPVWDWIDVPYKHVYERTGTWGRWIEDETSDWHYWLKYRYRYSWWQQERRDAADRQGRREDRLNYKIKTSPYDMNPWDEFIHEGRGKVARFKSWKHGTKHRKQWMKNLED